MVNTTKVSKFWDPEDLGVPEFQILKLKKAWNQSNLVENKACLVSFRPDFEARTEYSIKILSFILEFFRILEGLRISENFRNLEHDSREGFQGFFILVWQGFGEQEESLGQ